MNKKFISLLIGIMCLSGCGKDNSSFASSQTSSIISENSLNSEASLNKLNTPSLTINEKTGVVSWEAIENAEYYNSHAYRDRSGTNKYNFRIRR